MLSRKDFLFHLVTTAITLVVTNVSSVDANWVPWSSSEERVEGVSLNILESFWMDAVDVLTDLDSYDKLWIKPHSCVWSECAVDDADDNYMGDNRDGDEQWYQYRTQSFCANAAYSLYGQKKEDEYFPSFFGCTRRHYINSFFTYGGADNLLKSVGESPVVYSYDGADYDSNDNGNNDDGSSISENAVCVEIEYDIGGDDEENEDEENDDNSNSGSNSNDNNDGYSGTLGCGTNGEYVIAAFQSASCDGNYFAGIVDELEEYNEQHRAIGCHSIYEKGNEVSVENVMMLLSNSWSCDLRLYPNGCPDPFGEKKNYDFAIRTVARGGNPQLAYRNMMLKLPIRIISWILFAVTLLIFLLAYIVENETRAIESKGGKNIVGYLRCIGEDIVTGWGYLCTWAALKWSPLATRWAQKWKKDRQYSTEDKLAKKVADDAYVSTDDSDSYVQCHDDVESKTGDNSGVAPQQNVKNGAGRRTRYSGGVALRRSVTAKEIGPEDETSADRAPQKDEDVSKTLTWS